MKEKSKKFYFAPITTLIIIIVIGIAIAVFAPPIGVKIFGVVVAAFPAILIFKTKKDLVLEVDDEKMRFAHEDTLVNYSDIRTWSIAPGGTGADILIVITNDEKQYSVASFNTGAIARCLNDYISDKELRRQNMEKLQTTKQKGKWKSWFKEITRK